MAEIWGAAIAAVGAVAGGMAASKKAKEDRKAATEDRKVATRDEALYGGIMSRFEAEQEDYYNQKNRQRKERGLDQFRVHNTVGEFNPNRIEVPVKPTIEALLPVVPDPAAAPRKKKSRGLFDKITDPAGILGGKASKIADPAGIFGG